MRKEFATFVALLLPIMALIAARPALAANCDAYPYTTLVNGTTADASQVMGNFTAILSCANTLAPANGPLFTGNVGIGTTSPTNKLSVESTNPDAIRLKGNTSGSASYGAAYFIAESNIDYRSRGLLLTTTDQAANSAWFAGVPYNGAGFQIGLSSTHTLESSTGPYQKSNAKLFINTSGNVGIGTTSPNMMLSVNGDADKASGGTAWSVFSDKRLKNIIGAYNRGLEDIVQLHPIVFRYKKDNPLRLPSVTDEVGVVAQDVRTIFPEAVEQGKDGFLEFNMSPVQFAMINAIKQLKAEIDRQKAINTAQAREIEELLADNARQKADIASLRAAITARTEALIQSQSQQARVSGMLRRLAERVDALERPKIIRTSTR